MSALRASDVSTAIMRCYLYRTADAYQHYFANGVRRSVAANVQCSIAAVRGQQKIGETK